MNSIVYNSQYMCFVGFRSVKFFFRLRRALQERNFA